MSPRRLRSAEWLAAAGGVALLLTLFVVHWYGPRGAYGWWTYPAAGLRPTHRLFTGPRDGWQAMSVLRWPLLLTGVAGITVAVLQGIRPGPALPVVADLLTTLLAGATTLALLVRLATTGAPLRFGAVLGVITALAVTRGAYRAMRVEQGWSPGRGRAVPVVALPGAGPG